jgi:hypothetical protein
MSRLNVCEPVILSAGQSLAHGAIPGFNLSVAELFAIIAPPQ